MLRAISKRNMRNIIGVLLKRNPIPHFHYSPFFHIQNPSSLSTPSSHLYAFSSISLRFFTTNFSHDDSSGERSDEGASTDGWEEEYVAEPKIGDGGDGGGVALQNVPWGQRAHSIAKEVLTQFTEDIELYAFKTTPRGYVYVRLDKITNEYGCPSMEELERYNQEFKKRLDEVGALGEIPDDLGIEVSSPGAERILKVPDDLSRFKDMPMRVCYTENVESNCPEEDGLFLLESIDRDSEICIWKLANIKENRDPLKKGKPLNRKQKDWRLKLPFNMHRMVTLYLD
ncbi:hypothetical protein Lal_00025154 [Lupinus albus]|uniref:DUF7912 domain-containing protein n=1 Tax=Lupinus albus TaxID=3870 RepID=A0A6A5NXV0_LUPAL|nr:hypothetical protein Lalb_Chr10g0098921 [Lupinus albus]KAF1889825.1 hypothetical protein Lal_00025154 [Lupinus albus]